MKSWRKPVYIEVKMQLYVEGSDEPIVEVEEFHDAAKSFKDVRIAASEAFDEFMVGAKAAYDHLTLRSN